MQKPGIVYLQHGQAFKPAQKNTWQQQAFPQTHKPRDPILKAEREGKQVAFVVSLPFVNVAADGTLTSANSLAVLAAAVNRANSLSHRRDKYVLVALLQQKYEPVGRAPLEGLGYKVISCDIPVPVEAMAMPLQRFAKNDQGHDNSHKIVDEHIQLRTFALEEYDKVVSLEPDVLVMDALDELIDDSHELLGIYDYYGWVEKMSVIPPINGGFFVLTPSNDTFTGLVEMVKRGSFSGAEVRDGFIAGWDETGIGYYFGGISLQGLLSTYYHKELVNKRSHLKDAFDSVRHDPSLKFKEIDQCVYNCLGHPNCLGASAGVQGTLKCKNVDCDPKVNPTAVSVKENAKVAHFTGSCWNFRPYVLCSRNLKFNQAQELRRGNLVCSEFTKRWTKIGKVALQDPTVKKWAPNLKQCIQNLEEIGF